MMPIKCAVDKIQSHGDVTRCKKYNITLQHQKPQIPCFPQQTKQKTVLIKTKIHLLETKQNRNESEFLAILKPYAATTA